MRTLSRISLAALVVAALAGCTSAAATPTEKPVPATPASKDVLKIAYGGSAHVELIAPSGQRVFIDIADPSQLTAPPTKNDILLTTHLHPDHYVPDFGEAFPGQQVLNKSGSFTFGDVKVVSLDASHTDDPIDPADPTNHIFVVEFAGFKIVHMGSTAQTQLTPEQLAAIGSNVDIAVGALTNVGGSDPDNSKQIDIVDQIEPKLLIPTHTDLKYVQAAGKHWATTWTSKPVVTIPKAELPAKTLVLFMGNVATSYGAILKVPESKW